MSINNKLIKYAVMSAVVLSSFAMCANSQAASSSFQHKNYALIDLGVAFPTKLDATSYGSQKPKSSLYYGVGFGSNCHDYLKLDVTLSRMEKAKFDKNVTSAGTTYAVKQNFTSTMLMFNASAKVNYGNFMPYLTAGAGATYNEAKDYAVAQQGTYKGAGNMRFAWSVGLGVDYKVGSNTSINLGYKYFDLNKAKTSTTFTSTAGGKSYDSAVSTRLKTHVASIGMRYSF